MPTNSGNYADPVRARVHSAMVTLDNEQIMSLPSLPVQVVPAPGVNRITIPIHAHAILSTAAQYNSLDGPAWALFVGDYNLSSLLLVQGKLGSVGASFFPFPCPGMFNGSGVFDDQIAGNDIPLSAIVNTAITIRDTYNNGGDYTDGDAANWLSITVAYLVVDSSTGAFL